MLRGCRFRGEVDHKVLGGVIKDTSPGSTHAILTGRGTAQGAPLGTILIVALVVDVVLVVILVVVLILEIPCVLLVAAVADLVLHQQFQRWQFGVMAVWTPVLVNILRIGGRGMRVHLLHRMHFNRLQSRRRWHRWHRHWWPHSGPDCSRSGGLC